MSWSVSAIGTPSSLVAYLEGYGDAKGWNPQSLLEYNDAKPHLIGLIKQNFLSPEYKAKYPDVVEPTLSLRAAGSGSAVDDGVQHTRTLSVTLEYSYAKIVS